MLISDVLVLGGGPVGSYTASQLASKGYSTTILEQKSDPGDSVCCTGIVSEECLQAYRIDSRLVFRHCKGARIYTPSGKSIELRKDSHQAAVLDRPAFNSFMAGRARDTGAEYLTNWKVTDIRSDSKGVTVVGQTDEGQKCLETRAVVLATGASSTLTQKVGLGKSRYIVTGAQASVDTEVDEVQVYVSRKTAPDFFAWLVPTSPHKGLAGLLAKNRPQEKLRSFLDALKKGGQIASNEVAITSAPLPLSPLGRTFTNRMIVVGTAAGLVKPTTGGGIYFGLLSADMAVGVLDEAFRKNDLSSNGLAAYEHLWKRKLFQELRIGSWARRLFEHMSDARLEQAFDIIQRTGALETALASQDLSFDWHRKTILNLLKRRTLAKLLIGGIRPPFLSRPDKADCTEGDTD